MAGRGLLRTSFRACKGNRTIIGTETTENSHLADIENKISHQKNSPPDNSIKVPNQKTEEERIENFPSKKGTKFEEEIPKSVMDLEN